MSERRGALRACLAALALLLAAGCAARPAQSFAVQQNTVYAAADLPELGGLPPALYRAYRAEQVQVQQVQSADGLRFSVETWQLPDPPSAYGLFTRLCQARPVRLGNEGCSDGARLAGFWQERYTVILRASGPAPAGLLEEYARGEQARLPSGGEKPALVSRVPAANRANLVYFYEEAAILEWLPLGGKNILGLGPQTGGVLAEYSLDGKPAQLLLIEYPDEGGALAGLRAVQNYGLPDLLLSGSQGRLLAAVFGQASPQPAGQLLAETLR